jgi:osmotically-inducible protein OsmY
VLTSHRVVDRAKFRWPRLARIVPLAGFVDAPNRQPPTGDEPAATTTELPSLSAALFQPFSDAWLAARSRFALLASLGIDAADIAVEAYRGSVILAGDVGSRAASDAAERAVREVPSVVGVANRLRVRGEECVRGGATDAEIRTGVTAQLRHALPLRGSIVTVESVYDGVVRLAGVARDVRVSEMAFELAHAVPGVRRVINDVVLATEPAADDDADAA